jgi:hypothetical protein
MWHLDPTELSADEEWAQMDDGERQFYFVSIDHVIRELRPYGLRFPTTATKGGVP